MTIEALQRMSVEELDAAHARAYAIWTGDGPCSASMRADYERLIIAAEIERRVRNAMQAEGFDLPADRR